MHGALVWGTGSRCHRARASLTALDEGMLELKPGAGLAQAKDAYLGFLREPPHFRVQPTALQGVAGILGYIGV